MYASFDKDQFVYKINRSPICDIMVSFIHRLMKLTDKHMMNSVLENFTILQVQQAYAHAVNRGSWHDCEVHALILCVHESLTLSETHQQFHL